MQRIFVQTFQAMDEQALTFFTLFSYSWNSINCSTIHHLFRTCSSSPRPGEPDGVLYEQKINLRNFKFFIEENCASKDPLIPLWYAKPQSTTWNDCRGNLGLVVQLQTSAKPPWIQTILSPPDISNAHSNADDWKDGELANYCYLRDWSKGTR